MYILLVIVYSNVVSLIAEYFHVRRRDHSYSSLSKYVSVN